MDDPSLVKAVQAAPALAPVPAAPATQVAGGGDTNLPDWSWGFDNGAFLFRKQGQLSWEDATGHAIASPAETAFDAQDIASYERGGAVTGNFPTLVPGWGAV